MNTNLAFNLNIDQIEADAKQGQENVVNLLNHEERLIGILEEASAMAEISDRLETVAKVATESKALQEVAKGLADMLDRIRKRLGEVEKKSIEAVKPDVEQAGGKVQTKSFEFNIKNNPPKVIVDDLSAIPKKYRSEPKPIPEWTEWDADKAAIKSALTKEKVQSISGVHLDQDTRLEIKPR